MEVWGLTGPMGSGKSLALDFFSKVPTVFVIDADKVTQSIYDPSFSEFKKISAELAKIFGPQVLSGPKALPQKDFIRTEVNRDPGLRVKLEKMIHPFIRSEIEKSIKKLDPKYKLVVLEGTRLVESDWAKKLLTGLICIDASVETRKERVKKRNPDKFNQVWPLSDSQDVEKMKSASQYVWINENDKSILEKNILEFLRARGLNK